MIPGVTSETAACPRITPRSPHDPRCEGAELLGSRARHYALSGQATGVGWADPVQPLLGPTGHQEHDGGLGSTSGRPGS
jgi:hypothetical protein